MAAWISLYCAIVFEVIATSALKASESFSKIGPSILVVLGYSLAFYLLSQSLKTIPVGIAYAIWSGVGIILITLIAWLLFAQKLDLAALMGIGLIIMGVIVLNVFSGLTIGK